MRAFQASRAGRRSSMRSPPPYADRGHTIDSPAERGSEAAYGTDGEPRCDGGADGADGEVECKAARDVMSTRTSYDSITNIGAASSLLMTLLFGASKIYLTINSEINWERPKAGL